MEDFKPMVKMASFEFTPTKPNHSITFHDTNEKEVGSLDFNGDYMKFEGNAEASAITFFAFISEIFSQRLKDEYQRGYDDAKKENA